MIIHKTRRELVALIEAIDRLPMEGSTLQEMVSSEYNRQKTKAAMLANITPPTTAVVSNTPTTLIDDAWGLRLGLIQG